MKDPEPPADPGTERMMPFAVRPLVADDATQASEIERDAFPEMFPPTSFTRELGNRVARYLVAWRREDVESDRAPNPYLDSDPGGDGAGVGVRRFIRNAKGLLPWRTTAWEPGQQFLAGFLGIMAGDRRSSHRFGGGAFRLPRTRGGRAAAHFGQSSRPRCTSADRLTLEVRVSNYVAQNLYTKYGFSKRGLRKAYYADNREDAYIMTTGSIRSPSYAEELRQLVAEHEQRWGRACRDW